MLEHGAVGILLYQKSSTDSSEDRGVDRTVPTVQYGTEYGVLPVQYHAGDKKTRTLKPQRIIEIMYLGFSDS